MSLYDRLPIGGLCINPGTVFSSGESGRDGRRRKVMDDGNKLEKDGGFKVTMYKKRI